MAPKVSDDTSLDCGDNGCYFATSKGGMRTNGGCRCFSAAGFDKGIHAAAREMLLEVLRLRVEREQLAAERDAAVAKLTPNIKKLVAEDGELTMTLDDPYKITAIIARSLRDLVEAEGGPNYAEMSFKEVGVFKPIVVAVAKSAEQTPHALRLKVERERDDLVTQVAALMAETKQQRTLLAAMRQSCLAWFDNPNGPWGWECVACGAQFTKGSGPGQPPSETRAYAELAHAADCVFHPTPQRPHSSDGDLP